MLCVFSSSIPCRMAETLLGLNLYRMKGFPEPGVLLGPGDCPTPCSPDPFHGFAWEETNLQSQDETEDATPYRVVLNHEEQYSIWPAHRENPLGWSDDGMVGTKAECLAYIDEKWTDMRPLSLRRQLDSR